MSLHHQLTAEREVDARMQATAAARPEATVRPLAGVRCPECGQSADAYPNVEALRRAGWLATAVGWFDSRSCLDRYNRQAARMGQLMAVLECDPPPVQTAPTPSPTKVREVTVRCARSDCTSILKLHQERDAATGEWRPDTAKILEFSGWRRGLCSWSCETYLAAEQRIVAAYEPTPVAITRIADASYQAHRTAARAAAGRPELAGREVPDARPRGRRP